MPSGDLIIIIRLPTDLEKRIDKHRVKRQN